MTPDDNANALRFYQLTQEFNARFRWSFARIARDGLGIPSQWLYRYHARAKVALGEDATMKGDRAPSKGTVRAMELLLETHEQAATIAHLRESVAKLATGEGDPGLSGQESAIAELTEQHRAAVAEFQVILDDLAAEHRAEIAKSYEQWSVKNLRSECARRNLPGKAGDVLADYVERLVAADAAE